MGNFKEQLQKCITFKSKKKKKRTDLYFQFLIFIGTTTSLVGGKHKLFDDNEVIASYEKRSKLAEECPVIDQVPSTSTSTVHKEEESLHVKSKKKTKATTSGDGRKTLSCNKELEMKPVNVALTSNVDQSTKLLHNPAYIPKPSTSL